RVLQRACAFVAMDHGLLGGEFRAGIHPQAEAGGAGLGGPKVVGVGRWGCCGCVGLWLCLWGLGGLLASVLVGLFFLWGVGVWVGVCVFVFGFGLGVVGSAGGLVGVVFVGVRFVASGPGTAAHAVRKAYREA
ncbi:hypothetical protein RA276_28225, partial [Pseudomonas syringae pv. tagetis]|uniref:hypothetical protein n=1 Tax=Pseudomonas syringae group genomosp. 7 TaxID=251699 RepID=UPI00376F5C0C